VIPSPVRNAAQPLLAPLETDGAMARLLRELFGEPPVNGLFLPITVGPRVVAVLYGDNRDAATSFDSVRDLFHLAWAAGTRLDPPSLSDDQLARRLAPCNARARRPVLSCAREAIMRTTPLALTALLLAAAGCGHDASPADDGAADTAGDRGPAAAAHRRQFQRDLQFRPAGRLRFRRLFAGLEPEAFQRLMHIAWLDVKRHHCLVRLSSLGKRPGRDHLDGIDFGVPRILNLARRYLGVDCDRLLFPVDPHSARWRPPHGPQSQLSKPPNTH
jgi:hypothetical protein